MSKIDQNIKTLLVCIFFILEGMSHSFENKRIPGYLPIWFELNQKYEYEDKYSGALGTYSAKHHPLGIYAEAVNKTFFVFRETKSVDSKHLLCMIGEYDYETDLVTQPMVVCDKMGEDDPHDNLSIMIDQYGYIWVFVSGRERTRIGYKYKSINHYSIKKSSTS